MPHGFEGLLNSQLILPELCFYSSAKAHNSFIILFQRWSTDATVLDMRAGSCYAQKCEAPPFSFEPVELLSPPNVISK